jgi:multimeric flavodoxin WrbA
VITILNLSRRVGGTNDTLCDLLYDGLAAQGLPVQQIRTRELTIQFCTNCRACMKAPGEVLGLCPLVDDMAELLAKLMASTTIILSAPINCYDLPSILHVIIERMGVYCYWSDDSYSPKVRKVQQDIRGILITTSAMPSIMVPLTTQARKTFRLFAKPIGMKRISYYHLGFKGRAVDMPFNDRDRRVVNIIIAQLASAAARLT